MENNTKEIFYAIYCLMSLVTLEADDADVSVDMIRFCLDIQVTFSLLILTFFDVMFFVSRQFFPTHAILLHIQIIVVFMP